MTFHWQVDDFFLSVQWNKRAGRVKWWGCLIGAGIHCEEKWGHLPGIFTLFSREKKAPKFQVVYFNSRNSGIDNRVFFYLCSVLHKIMQKYLFFLFGVSFPGICLFHQYWRCCVSLSWGLNVYSMIGLEFCIRFLSLKYRRHALAW